MLMYTTWPLPRRIWGWPKWAGLVVVVQRKLTDTLVDHNDILGFQLC